MATFGKQINPAEEDENAVLKAFEQYAKQQKIAIRGSLKPCYFVGSGLGFRATGAIEPDTALIYVPTSALLTPKSISESFCSGPVKSSLTTHALLAAFLAFDEAFNTKHGEHVAWKATWPSFEDFKATLPLLWPIRCKARMSLHSYAPLTSVQSTSKAANLQSGTSHGQQVFAVVPPRVAKLLEAQTARYRRDLEATMSLIPRAKAAYDRCARLAEIRFTYAWCIVNTRCLYFDPSADTERGNNLRKASKYQSRSSDGVTNGDSQKGNQHMVLCPLIDIFNHTSTSDSRLACKVTHDASGFIVASQKLYHGEGREQVFVSYGPYSNDFLLVEYGFLLPGAENAHDSVSLDSAVQPLLSQEQQKRLGARGYLGEYTLFSPAANGGAAGVCWRTEVVARIGIMGAGRWDQFVDGLLDEESPDATLQAQRQVQSWVEQIHSEASASMLAMERLVQQQEMAVAIFGDEDDRQEERKSGDGRAHPMRQKQDNHDTGAGKLQPVVATKRHSLVLTRWKQILIICEAYLSQQTTLNPV